MFQECGTCNACCLGALIGNAYGNPFGPKPCIFLCKTTCMIYSTRPESCQSYQCAWSQGLFTELERPDISRVLVSVEVKDRKQFLKCIDLGSAQSTNDYLETWAKENETHCEWISYDSTLFRHDQV